MIVINSLNDVINRLVEIINNSEEKRKGEAVDNFIPFLGKNILKDDIEEFKELCDIERTILVFQNSLAPYHKNKDLMAVCEKQIEKGEYQEEYQKLLTILNNAYGKKVSDLTEINGYFILRSAEEEFLRLDRKLNFRSANSLNNAEAIDVLKRGSINNPAAREKRINKYLTINKLVNLSLYKKGNLVSYANALRQDLVNSKHFDVICLALFGEIDLDGISALGYIYSEADYSSLLQELINFNIFSPEDILKLKNTQSLKVNPKLSELIGELAVLPNLTLEGIKEFRLVGGIGNEGLDVMINILYNLKALPESEYQKYKREKYDREMSQKLNTPFKTFNNEKLADVGKENPTFTDAVMAYAKEAGMGETPDEIASYMSVPNLDGNDSMKRTG